MSYQYIYDPVALAEYVESIDWYNQQNKTVATDFVEEVKERIANICEHPLRYRNTYKNFREASLKKFPFLIVYIVDKEKELIIITSVFHQSRNPKKKFSVKK